MSETFWTLGTGGFETILLSESFTNLKSLSWAAEGQLYHFDDIELHIVESDDPTTSDQCKNGGWEDFGFRNQGQCVRFVEKNENGKDKER